MGVAQQRGQVVYQQPRGGQHNKMQPAKRVGVIINSTSKQPTISRRPNTTSGNTRIITTTNNNNKSYIVNNNNNRMNNNNNRINNSRMNNNNNRINNNNLSSIYSDQVTVNSEGGGTSYSLLDIVDSLTPQVQKNVNNQQGRQNQLKGRHYKQNE